MKNTIIEKYAGSCWGNSIDKSHLLKVSAYFDTVLKKNPPTTYNSPPKWLNCVQSSLLLWKSGLTYRLEMCNEIDWIFTPDLIGDEEIGCLKIALDLQRTHRKCAPKKGHVKYFQNWPDNICREFADISLMNMLTNAHNRAYIPQGGKKKGLLCSGVEEKNSNKPRFVLLCNWAGVAEMVTLARSCPQCCCWRTPLCPTFWDYSENGQEGRS